MTCHPNATRTMSPPDRPTGDVRPMGHVRRPQTARCLMTALVLALVTAVAHADVVTDWNQRCEQFIAESKLGTPPAVRVMAIVATAVHGAVAAADATGASVDAAVAAAHRVTLVKLLPAQQAAVQAAYGAAIGSVADGGSKNDGIAAGEMAAGEVLARRLDDGAARAETYRPHTTAGAYVATAVPAIPQWPQRRPWFMNSASQLRPEAPPALTSAAWARDFNEVLAIGGRTSSKRSTEVTEIARFWDYSLPAVYHGVLRSVASQPGRDVARNARFFALASQAMDDALIATFDAKYFYNFWRPVTAIRNGDIDGNDATAREAGWLPLIDTPMHPEYPSAHSALAASLGEVIKAEVGSNAAMPTLATSSPTVKPGTSVTRRWASVDDFVREVGEARIGGGIHYRGSIDAGERLGKRVAELALRRAANKAD
jgi:hypothetical protein